MSELEKIAVHVEAILSLDSIVDYDDMRRTVATYLCTNNTLIKGIIPIDEQVAISSVLKHIYRLEITDIGSDNTIESIPHWNASIHVHVFKLSSEPPAEETTEDDENVTTSQQLTLPSASLDGLWESLIYDTSIKSNLLNFASTAMVFADAGVNSNLISWNRIVLLHGPPGTGKTSLCKALAQKLSIRLCHRYPESYLLEINAHSLFSKWFSESGKLVMKLFQQIQDLVEDPSAFVCVLIDEVESLTAARKAAMNGSEPSDAIRVVNALLTQLDNLKRFSNVLVLTTSNITGAIDVAFVDRADIKQYIGLPSISARYEILKSCVLEIARVKLISEASAASILTYRDIIKYSSQNNANNEERKKDAKRQRLTTAESFEELHVTTSIDDIMQDGTSEHAQTIPSNMAAQLSLMLLQAAEQSNGFSGRALRKLPFQTFALFVPVYDQISRLSGLELIKNMSRMIAIENTQRGDINQQ